MDNIKNYCVACHRELFDISLERYNMNGNYCTRCCSFAGERAKTSYGKLGTSLFRALFFKKYGKID